MSRRPANLKADAVTRRVAKLYRKPFRLDLMGLYILDAHSNMVAYSEDGAFCARGWGRIQYLKPHPEVLFDVAAQALHLACEGVTDDLGACVDRLNERWSYDLVMEAVRKLIAKGEKW